MKFSEFKYERPDIELFKKQMEDILERLDGDITVTRECEVILEVYRLQDELLSMGSLANIRHTINTKDEFYTKEQAFMDENEPFLQQYMQMFAVKIIGSKNREALEDEFGSLVFEQVELEMKTFKPEIIPDLQLENTLSSKYLKLIASIQIEFNEGVYNLNQLVPFMKDINRETRHRAQLALSGWLEKNEEEIDYLYDELVKVRTKIAKELGYKNFVQLGYDRLRRADYNADNVKTYRDQILENVVPLVNKLQERKAKRIHINNPKSYDLRLSFLTGNPTPKGDRAHLVLEAKKMYEEMSKETGEFFNFMIDNELLDLDAKAGKDVRGYCTYIPKYSAPFIFANFNGTSGDVNTLTHEAGHAFQIYSSKDLFPPYRFPTMESAEIHSMSMELLAWPWIHKFFNEDTDKYLFNHLSGAVSLLPYGAIVDEFQHGVYENPDMNPTERKDLWRSIEKKYSPGLDYGDDEFMEKGTYWYIQLHIFSSPFYFIDYTLAQVCALQYWIKAQQDHSKALDEYKVLCALGGSKSFLELLKSAKLDNPFIKGTVKKIIEPIQKYLDSIDDTKL